METVAAREPPVSFVRRGFLLPRTPSLPFEVGGFSRRGDSKEVVGSPRAIFDVTLCLQAMGISFEGNEKGFWQRLEVPVSTPKIKGNTELHNLECDINYDARSLGSTRGKSKRALLWCNIAEGFWAGFYWVFLEFLLWLGLCRFFSCFFALSIFVSFCILPICLGAPTLYKISLITYQKKETTPKKLCNSSNNFGHRAAKIIKRIVTDLAMFDSPSVV